LFSCSRDSSAPITENSKNIPKKENGSETYSTPEKVVERYCELDFKGYGLSSDSFQKLEPLMHFADDRDCPGWDICDVVSGYLITDQKVDQDKATVTVAYALIGYLDEEGKIELKNQEDLLKIELVLIDQQWKIADCIQPRISVETAGTRLKELLKDASEEQDKNQDRIKLLQTTIDTLSAIKTKN
jgi:hypothetical protein